jgi:molybdopterin molybdotransferase
VTRDRLRALVVAVPRTGFERVPLAEANGRFLAEDAIASSDYWPFDRAAMDGIAIRAGEVATARPERPVALALAGNVYCGDDVAPPPPPQSAVRIATGAPLPLGTDTVVPQELVVFANGTATVARPIAPGKNVFHRGEDMRAGERVLTAGTRLHGAQLAVLAALGLAEVAVARRVHVAVLACGDELVEPGEARGGGRVTDSNSLMLVAEIDELGAHGVRFGIVRDEPQAVRAALERAAAADAVVICGGLSVGERDYVRSSLQALDARFAFEGAPIAPGHPVTVAFVRGVPVFALPGTPGACRIAFEACVRPALLAMLGATRIERPRVWARLTQRLDVRPGRTRFIWAHLGRGGSDFTVTPLLDQGTATIRSASDADALIVLPPSVTSLEAGLGVETWLLEAPNGDAFPDMPRAAVAVVGPRNAGKTTLVERLIPALAARGIRVGAVKRHGHMETLDDPAKDTGRTAAAGAAVTLLTGALGYVERRAVAELTLEDALAALRGVDLALVEGYADSALAKILVVRTGVSGDRVPAAPPIVAVVGDVASETVPSGEPPAFGWDEVERLADYLISRYLT